MFSIIDSRTHKVVDHASTYERAKYKANLYRSKNYIRDWKLVTIKRSFSMPTVIEDDGCCDSIRDRNCELFGVAHF